VWRRPVTNGWGFDFNYTWSHSLDNVSGAESDTTGTGVQDAFNPDGYRGPSNFDIRHNVTANAVVELPFGHQKHFLKTAPGWVDAILGAGRYRCWLRCGLARRSISATPACIHELPVGGARILRPGATMPTTTCSPTRRASRASYFDSAVNSFEGQDPGTVGTRGILRFPDR